MLTSSSTRKLPTKAASRMEREKAAELTKLTMVQSDLHLLSGMIKVTSGGTKIFQQRTIVAFFFSLLASYFSALPGSKTSFRFLIKCYTFWSFPRRFWTRILHLYVSLSSQFTTQLWSTDWKVDEDWSLSTFHMKQSSCFPLLYCSSLRSFVLA